jgi:acyl-CoA synthetase (AMP-forming)/AMP-acid ligase II
VILMNLTELILSHARLQPRVPAIIDGQETITYGELADLVLRTARHLATLGVAHGDHVALCLNDDSQHVVALLAISHLGATAVQIDLRMRPTERARIVDEFSMRLALVTPGNGKGLNCPNAILDADWTLAVAATDQTIGSVGDWHSPLAALASSGTTGLPKFTLATHLQYYFHMVSYMEVIPPRRHRYLSSMPLFFSAGRVACLSHLLRGDTLILHPILFSPEEFIENILRHKITVAFVVPSTVRQLLAIANSHTPLLHEIELLLSAGAPLFAEEKLATVHKVTPQFCEMYGAAAIGPMTALRSEELLDRPASVGRPFAFIDIEIVDENDQQVDPGAGGRLRCRGPGLSFPRTNSSTETAADFRDGWYYPGELATLDHFGFIFLQGRTSDVIFRGGAKIFPNEVEAVLQAHESVAEAAVVGRALSNNEQELVAYVVARKPLTSGDLLAHCRTRLSAFKVPREIYIVAELPRNLSGKIDKRALT